MKNSMSDAENLEDGQQRFTEADMHEFVANLPELKEGWKLSSSEILMPLSLHEVWFAFFADNAKYGFAANMKEIGTDMISA